MQEREWLEATKERIKRLRLYMDEQTMEDLLTVYLIERDPERKQQIKDEIEGILSVYSADLEFSQKPVLAVPPAPALTGEITIGRMCQAGRLFNEFRISKEALNQHMLITARAGHGKTVLIMNILRELFRQNIPWLAFDFKLDLRHMVRQYPQIWVIRWEDLRLNPLRPPPGVPLHRWKQIIVDCFSHCFGFFHGSRNYLTEHLDRLYREKGEGTSLKLLYDLVASSHEYSRRRSEYSDVVENRLYSTTSNLGPVIDCEKGFAIEKMLQHPVVIELDGLGRDEQNLLAETFLFWIYAYRMAQRHRGKLRHVLVFDEGKRIFDVNKEYKQSTVEVGVAPVDIVTDEIRDFCEALIVADQEPSKLTHSIKANTYTKITGCLGHGKDIHDISEAMNLNEEEKDVISGLERGEWLVKLSGSYTEPFTIKTDDFPIQKDVTDEEIKQRMKNVLADLNMDRGKPIKPKAHAALPQISHEAKLLLFDVNAHPFRGVTTRYKSLGLPITRRTIEAKNELIKKGLAKEESVNLGSHRPTKFLVPTNMGLQFLRASGKDTKNWRYIGYVGFDHRLYEVLIAIGLKKQGYKAYTEKDMGGNKRLDVYAVHGDRRIGVEVLASPSIDVEKAIAIAGKVDELVVACKDKSILESAQLALSECPPTVSKKLVLCLVGEYIAKLRRNYI